MNLKGNIRRGTSGLDIAFPHQGHWHTLDNGPLKTHISSMYEFLVSNDQSRTMFGRTFQKETRVIQGTTRTSVVLHTPFAKITLTRFSKDLHGNNSPSDKASISMEIPTVKGSQTTNMSQDFGAEL